MEETKLCSACKLHKELTEVYKENISTDFSCGYYHGIRECLRIMRSETKEELAVGDTPISQLQLRMEIAISNKVYSCPGVE